MNLKHWTFKLSFKLTYHRYRTDSNRIKQLNRVEPLPTMMSLAPAVHLNLTTAGCRAKLQEAKKDRFLP